MNLIAQRLVQSYGEVTVRHVPVEEIVSDVFPPSQFSDSDVDNLLTQLRDLSTRLSGVLRPADPNSISEPMLHSQVTNILRLRRQRNKLFGGDLFGEPAWDILLELYAAAGNGRKLSVSGACYASGVPVTTALRWILRLEKDGWIRRTEDPLDKRRSWLMLCDDTEKKMCEFLSMMAAIAA
jgi:DNA-binding MarR family transcriptional regulator